MRVSMRKVAAQSPEEGARAAPGAEAAAFFFANGSDLLAMVDAEGRFARVNPAWKRSTGWDEADLLGKPVAAFLHPDDAPALQAALAATPAADAPVGCRFATADAAYRLLDWRPGPACGEAGQSCLIARDATDAQRRDQQVRTLERTTGVGTWEIDVASRRAHWSPEMFRLHGLPLADTPPEMRAALDHFPDGVRPRVREALGALLSRGTPFDMELPFVTTDGRQRWVRTIGLADVQGRRPGKVFGTLSDVTDMRRERNWLERLSAVAHNTTNGVLLLDRDLCVEWANPAFERLSGYALTSIIGRSVLATQGCGQPEIEKIREINALLLRTGAARTELFKLRPDGSSYWVDVAVEAVRNIAGEITGYIAVETDITEAKEYARRLEALERAARAASERLTAAVEALPDAFVLFDAEDRLAICNQKYREFYPMVAQVLQPGVPFEVIERQALEIGQIMVAPDQAQAWLDTRLSGRVAGGETLVQHLPDGRVLRTVERRTASGELVAFHTDITELALKERAANAARTALQATLDAMPDLLFEIDMQGIFHDARDGTSTRLEHPEAWYIGRSIYDTLPAPSADRIMAAMEALLENERTGGANQVKPFDIDDSPRWFHVCVALKRTEAQTPRFVIVARDITDRKRIEDARARDAAELAATNARLERAMAERDAAEDRFFDVAGISHDWFWEQDADQRFTYISDSLSQLGGIGPASHIGRTREEIAGDEDDPELAAAIARIRGCIDRREPFQDIIYRHAMVRDRNVWVRVSGAPMYDARGNFTGYRGVGSNVTDLLEARLRAEEASAAKSRFLANMSHEIRTPLNGILGMATLLQDRVERPEDREMASIIRDSGEALATILNDILDFSKIEAGLMELSMGDFSPGELARKTESLHRLKAAEKGLRLSVEVRKAALARRRGDEHRILQILHNLIGNAIKFTEAGSVTVRFGGTRDGALELTVRDTGIGLTPQQKARIFDEFVQADSSISRRFGGTGLGLSITRRLVHLMDGSISIDTHEGAGTTVRVLLPLARSDTAPPPQPVAAEAMPAGLEVLVADDNATNRLLLGKFLDRLGVASRIVDGGRAAVQEAAERRFDLLLLDISMPDLTGPEALAAIRAAEAQRGATETPAIAVTANAMHHQVVEYLDAGFARHVGKPIRLDDLGSAIRQVLSLSAHGG